MDEDSTVRAADAAVSIAVDLGLDAQDGVVMQNSNKLSLRLVPCEVFARVALVGEEVAAFEVDLAQRLIAIEAPVVALETQIEPRVHERDGFAVTFWAYHHQSSADLLPPADHAHALVRLHAAMRKVAVPSPHFTDRVDEAQVLVNDRDRTPALDRSARELLLDTLEDVRHHIARSGADEQLLHGEPHRGNVLETASGPLFIDLETCCRGPVEFDVAHLPAAVSDHYPGLDRALLDECRRLVLAMVAAWRWDAADQFPDGRRHGRHILAILRNGPPWPTLDELTTTGSWLSSM